MIRYRAATVRERFTVRYFITFACYGAHLHGDESGSIDPDHHLFGTPVLDGDVTRLSFARSRMNQPPYELDCRSRTIVLKTLQEVCKHRGWTLLAAHVRSNHVHVVVEAEARPEKVMNDFKAYASRTLSRLDVKQQERRRWARHGSTRWLWKDADVREAVRYVVEEQGEPMAVFVGDVP